MEPGTPVSPAIVGRRAVRRATQMRTVELNALIDRWVADGVITAQQAENG
jgi:hypothetical protein